MLQAVCAAALFSIWQIAGPPPVTEEPVILQNPSFELPALSPQDSFFGGVEGWMTSGITGTTRIVPQAGSAPDGTQYMWGEFGGWSISQDVGPIEADTRYRFLVDVRPVGNVDHSLTLRITDRQTFFGTTFNELTWNPAENEADFVVKEGEWTTVGIGLNSALIPEEIGSMFRIRIEGSGLAVDNARLTKFSGPREYYISSSEGDDAKTGKSPFAAWQSFANLAGYTPLAAGDRVLLKRGDVFAEQLTLRGKGAPGDPIIVEAYGEGDRPVIQRQDVEYDVCFIWNNASYAEIRDLICRTSKIGIFLRYEWTDTNSTDVLIEDCHFEDMPDPTLDPPRHDFEFAWSDGIWVGGQAWNEAEFATRLNNLTVRRCTAENVAHLFGTGWYHPGVYKARLTNFLMEDCVATNTLSGAFQIFNVDGGTIRRVHSIGGGGKDTWSGLTFGFTQSVRNMVIEDSLFTGLDRAQAADGVGFDFEGDAENVIIRDNIIHDNDASGLLILATGGPNINLTVEGNTLYNNAADPWNSEINSEIQGSSAAHTGVVRNNVLMRRSPEVNFFSPGGNWTTLVRQNNILGEYADVANRPRWWEWDTGGDSEGWGETNDWQNFSVNGGMLTGTSGVDSFVVSPPTWGNSVLEPYVWVRMSQTAGEFAQVFWQTAHDETWDAEKSAFFPIIADGTMRDYFINIDEAGARGVVTRLRLDPTIEAGSQMAVDFVRIASSTDPAQQPPELPGPEPLDVSFVSIAAEDGDVIESARDSGTGGAIAPGGQTIRIGEDAQNRAFRPLLSFDTSSLPDNAEIVEATLGITRVGQITGQIPIGVADSFYEAIYVDVSPAFGGNPALSPSDWQAPAQRPGASKFAWPAYAQNMTIYSRLEQQDLDVINKSGRTQFRIRYQPDDDGDGVADYVSYASGDWFNASERPTLRVKYRLP